MRCCASEDHRLPSTAHRWLQPGTAWHQDMDTSCHLQENRTRVRDVGICWGQPSLLGQFLKRRMVVPFRSVPSSPLVAVLVMLMLLSWKTCEAGDLNLFSNSTFDDIIRLKDLDFSAMRRTTREIPTDLQGLRDSLNGGHHLNTQWKGKIWPCDVLLKLSRHVLISALGPNLAWSIFPYDSCDQDLKPTDTLISPLKLLQVNVKPMLLHRVLRFLGDLGFLVETQQSKALSLLKKKMYKSGKPLKDPSMLDRCPDKKPYLIPWHPGHDGRRSAVIGHGVALRLESSATFHSLLIQDGGSLVFADDHIPITLRAQYILIKNGGSLHIGSAKCPYSSDATISLYGKSTEGDDIDDFGKKFIGVDKGGILELHGRRPLSWTQLDATLHPGGLPYGSYKWEKHWGSRGINVRIIDPETGQVEAAERFDTHMFLEEGRRLEEFLSRQSPGKVVAAAVGDSAAKSLSPDVRRYLREVLSSRYIYHLGYRQPWALVGTLGKGALKVNEDRKHYESNGTTGLAFASREFQTYGGMHFTVTAYSGWIKGVPRNGFRVAVSRGIILTLADDVTSWLPGNRIVIASTDYSMHQAEEFTLLHCPQCKNNQVKIDGYPLYLHVGEVIDGIDMRAEVGLLTRNIVIKGEMEASCYGHNHCQFFSYDTFGGQIKIQSHFTSVHLSGIEITNMGQQILGSYPVHFHMAGAVDEEGGYNPSTYIDNLAIHHCFSRCVAIHGTHGLLIRDTIGYDTLGHCFFLEDGVEQKNTFYHNLGLVTKAGTILPTDRNEAMCLEMREHVYGDYIPVPSTDCMAVSTFWISNPNNNLIGNAAGGAQDVGIWYIFHRVPSGLSEGLYPEGHSEFTPLGIFLNNRVHSNFKAGLFIGKGVKTTVASAENPREYLTVDNARFRPHQDSDPAKPRVPALIDRLIAFKNNDHGAWARGGDIVFRNSGFSDSGIGLTLASDGTFPTDEGSSLEITDSIFVGESDNVGSSGGQNSYWGRGGSGEQRSLPRNKTFPIRGFQIYDGPVRLLRCTFKNFVPTAERPSSAIGFSLKNSWQITPQNNISQVKMERSMQSRVFFGEPGPWFSHMNMDGDKTTVFYDVDGSVSEYPGAFLVKEDNWLLRHPDCLDVPDWKGAICSGNYAQIYIQARRPADASMTIIKDEYPEHPLHLEGALGKSNHYQQYQPVITLQKGYTVHWDMTAPEELTLWLINFQKNDWIQVGFCYPKGTTFSILSDIHNRLAKQTFKTGTFVRTFQMDKVHQAYPGRGYYYWDEDSGLLFLMLKAQNEKEKLAFCSVKGCERVKIKAEIPKGSGVSNCQASAYPKYSQIPIVDVPLPKKLNGNDPEKTNDHLLEIKVESYNTRYYHLKDDFAYIEVDNKKFFMPDDGIQVVVIDGSHGKVVDSASFKTAILQGIPAQFDNYVTNIKDNSIVVIVSKGRLYHKGPWLRVLGRLGAERDLKLKDKLAFVGFKGHFRPIWTKLVTNAEASKIYQVVPFPVKRIMKL
ncbi:cell migration-inducing and hyaluronan-binding protein [Bufo bufo]|uniref:cell migration-inducing and hyaluronan-binding protein n=1 Tax=Bufo bufo TaxID=8384 RepID=UPI001ABE11E8|nr:cell migration-inducing and hyaluronan-binding protein [Bufo bufo]